MPGLIDFCMPEAQWQQFVDSPVIHAPVISLPAWAQQAEYIQPGLDFYLVWDRINQYLSTDNHTRLTIAVDLQVLSVTSVENLYAGVLGLRRVHNHNSQRIELQVSAPSTPDWLSLQMLPESYAEHLEYLWAWMIRQIERPEDGIHGFQSHEIQQLDQIIAWMRQGQQHDWSQQQAKFYQWTTQHDATHGTSLAETFPELQAWWTQCQARAT